ncbi:bifunctional nuclease domain-containing protein [Pseudonocardia benzenivorans]
MSGGTFSADIVFDAGTRVAARPSDALSIAVRDSLPIGMAEDILDDVGQSIAELFPAAAPPPRSRSRSSASSSTTSPRTTSRTDREWRWSPGRPSPLTTPGGRYRGRRGACGTTGR